MWGTACGVSQKPSVFALFSQRYVVIGPATEVVGAYSETQTGLFFSKFVKELEGFVEPVADG